MAFAAVASVLAAACGGDGDGNGPDNRAPTANFAETCTLLSCTFDNTSTDPDGDALTYAWDFGDGETSTEAEPTHEFAEAGTYDVKLTASDGSLSGEKTTAVTVAGGGLTAGFTYNCDAGDCTFTNTSTSTGTIVSYAWDFGDPGSGADNQSDQKDPTHTYAVTGPTDFTVTLTVTDDADATDAETQTVKVSLDLVCTGGDCTILLSDKSIVTITVTSSDCEFIGNTFAITQPIEETVFTDGCQIADGTSFEINGGGAFDAGTELKALFTQGTKPRPDDPDPGPASTRVSGAFPDWTIEFDDGGNAGGPGEPDFNDIVLAVHAEVVP
jgi:PKD repeat protein